MSRLLLYTMPCVSSKHITKADWEALTSGDTNELVFGPVTTADKDAGMIIYIGEFEENSELSPLFNKLGRWAYNNGYSMVRLDDAGDIVSELDIYTPVTVKAIARNGLHVVWIHCDVYPRPTFPAQWAKEYIHRTLGESFSLIPSTVTLIPN